MSALAEVLVHGAGPRRDKDPQQQAAEQQAEGPGGRLLRAIAGGEPDHRIDRGRRRRSNRWTPAAITALIDRLEARGLVRRTADAADRRRVLVEATARAQALIEACYTPTARAGAEMLGAYGVEELQAIRRFLTDALALQTRMTEDLMARDRTAKDG